MENKHEFLTMWMLKNFLISCLLKPVPLVDDFGQNAIILQYTNLTTSNTKCCDLVIQLNKFCKVFYLWLYFYELK